MPKGVYDRGTAVMAREDEEVHEAFMSPEGMARTIGANHLAAESAAEFSADLDRGKPIDDGIDKSWKHFAYWRYCVNEDCLHPGHIERRGWIVIGPSKVNRHGVAQAQEFAEAYHAVSLEDIYGPMPQNPVGTAGPRQGSEIPGNPAAWLEHMFRQPGGFKEVPAEQWKHLKLYRSKRHAKHRPDVSLNDMTICKICPPFPSPMSREFVERAHFDAHTESVHQNERQSMAIAEGVGRAMATNNRSDTGNTELLALIAELRSELNELKNAKES